MSRAHRNERARSEARRRVSPGPSTRTVSGRARKIQHQTQQAVAAVEESARRSAEGAELVEQACTAFERIGAIGTDVSDRIAAIGESVAGFASVAEESLATPQQVSSPTQQTSASAQHISASLDAVASTADDLAP